MSILTQYIIREILKFIFIVLLMVISIYVAVDFFEKIDNFLRAGLPVSAAIRYFIYKTPFICAQIFPVCVLLSVIIVFGLMARNNEILAMRSCGLGIYSVTTPIVILGVIFSIVLFLFSEAVVPITSAKANKIWLRDVKKQSAVISREKNIWLKEKRRIINIKYYDSAKKSLHNLTIHYFNDVFKLSKRTDAGRGVYEDGKWRLYQIIDQTLNPATGEYDTDYYPERIQELSFAPENLKTVVKKAEEMNFKELYTYIQKVEDDGYDATTYWTDLHAKIAFPFICAVMCLIGLGNAGGVKANGNLGTGIAFGIGLAFLYWIMYSFCISLGYGEVLHPAIAAWAANFVFLCFGIYKTLNVES